jgi:WD40 repeat protein
MDASSGRTLATLGESDISAMAYSPDGSRIVTGSGTRGRIRIWDSVRLEHLLTLEIPEAVAEVAFSPEGDRIIGISRTGTIRIWQTGRHD